MINILSYQHGNEIQDFVANRAKAAAMTYLLS